MANVKPNPGASNRPGGPPPAPRRVGDQIVFFCPNGDRIVVPASLGGKTGLCTKCKVQVVIPAIEPSAPVDLPAVDGPRSAEPVAVAPVTAPTAVAEEGPPAVENPAVETGLPPESLSPAPTVDWDLVAGQSVAAVIPDLADFDGAAAEEGSPPEPTPGTDHHPAARLVARLWQERGHGGIIELHLAGGSVILPEWYEVAWSRGTHGLFASQATDGTVTMTAIAWDTLEKIVVRQVRDLPQGFE